MTAKAVTVSPVGSRKVSKKTAEWIRDQLQKKLTEDFGPRDENGRRSTGQRAIIAKIGIKQPVLNDLEAADGGLGVHALIALRNYLGLSLEELLHLEPGMDVPLPVRKPPTVPPREAYEILARTREMIDRAFADAEPQRKGPADDPPSRPRRRQ